MPLFAPSCTPSSRPYLRCFIAKLVYSVCALLICVSVVTKGTRAQTNNAQWNGGAGSWNNAAQWTCSYPNKPSGPCVPGAGFDANLNGGTIIVSSPASVSSIIDANSATLIVSQTSLSASTEIGDLASLQLTEGTVTTPVLLRTNLTMQNSTINGTAEVGNALVPGSATISGSNIKQLGVAGSLAMSSSNTGPNSALGLTGSSSITDESSFLGLIAVDKGGALTIDGASKINSLVSSPNSGSAVLIGGTGVGSLTLQGGSLLSTLSSPLVLGSAAGGNGTLNMNGAATTVSADLEIVGSSGKGGFTQNDGTNSVKKSLSLGDQQGSKGLYSLGAGALSAGTERVGNGGSGFFTQIGGTNTVSGTLTVAAGSGALGTYTLSGPAASSVSVGSEIIGDSGSDNFVQTGGQNLVSQDLVLGKSSAGTGTYILSNGLLQTTNETICDSGQGSMSQKGGIISTQTLTLGNSLGASGTYNLSANGVLLALSENIGTLNGLLTTGGVGTFNQTDGKNSVNGTLTINFAVQLSSYSISGGTLEAENIVNDAVFQDKGGNITGNITNNGNFNIKNVAFQSVNGNFINNGTVVVSNSDVQFLNLTFSLNGTYKADPSTSQFQNLNVGAHGYIDGAAGDIFSVTGGFQDLSAQNALWNTPTAELDFTGGGAHAFDLTGQNGGGFTKNFAWGTLKIDPGNTLNLGKGSGDALYVNFLQGLDISGNTITNIDGTPGLFLYYNSADP